MAWLYLLADRMVAVIIAVAVFECLLYIGLFFLSSYRTQQLCDSLHNMLRGVKEPPEADSFRSIHDEIAALLDCAESISKTHSEDFRRLVHNVRMQDARKIDLKTYALDSWSNVAGAIVQIFPLLGILGTILAIGQSMQYQGINADVSGIIKAFTNAIDTTVIGLLFAVVYMVVDALFQARANRLSNDLEKYRSIIKYYENP